MLTFATFPGTFFAGGGRSEETIHHALEPFPLIEIPVTGDLVLDPRHQRRRWGVVKKKPAPQPP